MKIYLAGPFRCQEELRPYAAKMKDMGFDVISSWLYSVGDWTEEDNEGCFFAEKDLKETAECDLFVLYCPRNRETIGRIIKASSECNYMESDENALRVLRRGGVTGGKDIEFGYALALKKRIVVVGDSGPVNLFHRLQEVEWCNNFDELFEKLS